MSTLTVVPVSYTSAQPMRTVVDDFDHAIAHALETIKRYHYWRVHILDEQGRIACIVMGGKRMVGKWKYAVRHWLPYETRAQWSFGDTPEEARKGVPELGADLQLHAWE